MEEWLSQTEGFNAYAFKYMLHSQQINPDYRFVKPLYYFASLFELRNPSFVEFMEEGLTQSLERIGKLPSGLKVTMEDRSYLIIDYLHKTTNIIGDLKVKLIINNTNTPFITSDNPVAKYNQYLEKKKCRSGIGFGALGLQIFLPVNFGMALFFYDPSVYKVGEKKKDEIIITDDFEIDQLNLIQYLNAYSTIYFNDMVAKEYVDKLKARSTRYQRANLPITERVFNDGTYPMAPVNDRRFYIINSVSESRIKLKLSVVKELSSAKARSLNPNDAHIRPKSRPYLELL